MKVRIEVGKTTFRLSKREFQELTKVSQLSQATVFPDGNKFEVLLTLDQQKSIAFNDSLLKVTLPSDEVALHKPSKAGLSFQFNDDTSHPHQIVFEVDIKKPPLRKQKYNT